MEKTITDEEVSLAESILFGESNKKFDKERRDFITNLDTIDLQAVPGSGKTTCLLAKLLILEKRLPFSDGSGILVISHTNIAIEEIKNRIGAHCPKIFTSPNFVGTIQSFVDHFLAFPFYTSDHGRRPSLDNDLYNKHANLFSEHFLQGFSRTEQNNAKYFLRSNEGLARSMRFALAEEKKVNLVRSINGKEILFKKPRSRSGWTEEEQQRVAKWCHCFKGRLLRNGYLCYDDAYFLASCYLRRLPSIRDLLQRRFRFAFVDEMQDMERHQHDLLEDIFYDCGKSQSVYQRLGDINQAIYGGRVSSDSVWNQNRAKTLFLNGSHRFTDKIASVVKYFGVSYREIEGRRKDEKELSCNPCLLIYDDTSILDVIPTFANLIERKRSEGAIPNSADNIYKAVGWVGKEHKEARNLSVKSYFPKYCKDLTKAKMARDSLKASVESCEGSSLPKVWKVLLQAVIDVLRLENAKDEADRYFTRSSFSFHLRQTDIHFYYEFKRRMYACALGVLKDETKASIASLREVISEVLKKFGLDVVESRSFVFDDDSSSSETSEKEQCSLNFFSEGDIEISLDTVHGVKGQTHTATLYLETAYFKEFESERLKEQFSQQSLNSKSKVRTKESAKISYVALSRPSHLLCFAVHKDRYEANLKASLNENWDIVEVEKLSDCSTP